MRGGALAVEQPGFGQDIGAGADAGDADASLGQGAHEARVFSQVRRRTPSPPATISVVIAANGIGLRASISTPEEQRTGPAFTAITLIAGASGEARSDLERRDRARRIEQLEIREDQDADHPATRVSADVLK